jgi:hypothetical protein
LSTDQMSYTKVRTEILNYVERKRDTINNDIKAMEVDHFDSDYHYGDWDWWQDDDEYEQLNYFQKGGKGGERGKGKGYSYKGKGEGKGFEDRGGKGGYEKGESKGEGFQGECSWCGTWGHAASKCSKKDQHVQEYRQANGIPEPAWPPTGNGGLRSSEDTTEKPTKSTASESPEMALDAMQSLGGYRLLCSLDKIPLRNRYAELREEDACPRGLCSTCHEEELPPGLWPRLQECYPRTKEKKKRSEKFLEESPYQSLGEPRRRTQICLGEPCRHAQVGKEGGKKSCFGEPCRRPQEKLSWRAVQAPTGKAVDLMSLDKMSQKSSELMSLDKKKIKFTVDSGAAETVCEKTDATDFPTIYGGSGSLTKYIMPNGEIVENDGEKHLKVKTAEGEKFIVGTQLTDVRKPLMSVSKVCDE